MRVFRVTFEDGNFFTTSMNGNLKDAADYYLGKYFNFGDTEDHPDDKMVKVIKVEEV